jgi:hypothetical protein
METFRKVVVLNENVELDEKIKRLALPLIKDFGPFALAKHKGKTLYGNARLFIPPHVLDQ